MSPSTSARVRGLLSITDDLEKIGDLYYQITMNLENKNNKKVYFVPKQRESLKEMFGFVEEALEVMLKNLETPSSQVNIAEAEAAEDKINMFRNELRSRHLKDVEKSKYSVPSGMVYNDVFIALEKIGDHIFAVSEGIIGRI